MIPVLMAPMALSSRVGCLLRGDCTMTMAASGPHGTACLGSDSEPVAFGPGLKECPDHRQVLFRTDLCRAGLPAFSLVKLRAFNFKS